MARGLNKGVPYYQDASMVQTSINAGLNPATGQPLRGPNLPACQTPEDFRIALRIYDQIQACNRYVWTGLPSGLTGQLIERILYYRTKGCFFHLNNNDNGGTFYFLPFNGVGGIDVYGEYYKATPLPFNGSSEDKKDKDKPVWIPGLELNIIKDLHEPTLDDFESGCVVLYDYTRQLSQNPKPRRELQDPLITQMSEMFPLLRTNMLANCGVKAMRVSNEDDQANVQAVNESIPRAAMTGKFITPMVGSLEFQDLTSNGKSNAQDYLMTMQAYDNFRQQMYGLRNGGLFDKSSYVNDRQAAAGEQNVSLQYQDGLNLRQEFCTMINNYFGLLVWCDSSEVVQGSDMNGDGQLTDNGPVCAQSEGETQEGGSDNE